MQSTDPAPGTQVQPGSTITLKVLQEKKDKKKEDDGAQVPNVIGQTLANAAQTLASAGYTNIAMTASRYPDAIVVDQQPSGGSSADAATRITLTTRSSSTTPTNGFGLLN